MKYKLDLIVLILLLVFYSSCSKENHSDLKNTKIQTISDEEMTEIVKNSIEFRDNPKVEKKITKIDKEIQSNPSNKNNLLIEKAGYEIALLRYQDAKETLSHITEGENGKFPLYAFYRMGITEFSLGNDEIAYKILSQLDKELLKTKISDVKWFHLRINPLLKMIDKKRKYQKLLHIQEKFPISNKKNCFFMDINPDDYTVAWSGKCKNGFTHGDGILKYSNGMIFTGLMEKGEMIKGKYQFLGGSVFDGTYKKGLQESGCILYENGYEYCGKFKNDKPDGIGTYFSIDKNKIRGFFERGRPVKGVAFCADGKKTRFKVIRSLPNGVWSVLFDCKKEKE